jgi:hypothetical protein
MRGYDEARKSDPRPAPDVERLVGRAYLALKWLPDIEQQLMADALAPFTKEVDRG